MAEACSPGKGAADPRLPSPDLAWPRVDPAVAASAVARRHARGGEASAGEPAEADALAQHAWLCPPSLCPVKPPSAGCVAVSGVPASVSRLVCPSLPRGENPRLPCCAMATSVSASSSFLKASLLEVPCQHPSTFLPFVSCPLSVRPRRSFPGANASVPPWFHGWSHLVRRLLPCFNHLRPDTPFTTSMSFSFSTYLKYALWHAPMLDKFGSSGWLKPWDFPAIT